MYKELNFSEVCPLIKTLVNLNASVDFETGFGCAISMDEISYSCSFQQTCSFFKREACLLLKYENEEN